MPLTKKTVHEVVPGSVCVCARAGSSSCLTSPTANIIPASYCKKSRGTVFREWRVSGLLSSFLPFPGRVSGAPDLQGLPPVQGFLFGPRLSGRLSGSWDLTAQLGILPASMNLALCPGCNCHRGGPNKRFSLAVQQRRCTEHLYFLEAFSFRQRGRLHATALLHVSSKSQEKALPFFSCVFSFLLDATCC